MYNALICIDRNYPVVKNLFIITDKFFGERCFLSGENIPYFMDKDICVSAELAGLKSNYDTLYIWYIKPNLKDNQKNLYIYVPSSHTYLYESVLELYKLIYEESKDTFLYNTMDCELNISTIGNTSCLHVSNICANIISDNPIRKSILDKYTKEYLKDKLLLSGLLL